MHLFIASAMGGLGDAADFIGLIIVGFTYLVIASFLAFSWYRHSLVAARVACVFIFAVGILLQPWVLFFPSSFGASDDPDLLTPRLLFIIWLLIVFVTIGCFARIIRHQKLKTDAHDAA
jgi:hypothetical protein